MKIGKTINKLADSSAVGVGLVGLTLAPFTGGTSFLLSLQLVGGAKLLGYGVECIEDELKKKGD